MFPWNTKPLIFSETYINVKMWCVLMYNNFLLNFFICSCWLKNKLWLSDIDEFFYNCINNQQSKCTNSMKLKASFEVRQTSMPHTYFGSSAWTSKKTSNVTLTYQYLPNCITWFNLNDTILITTYISKIYMALEFSQLWFS